MGQSEGRAAGSADQKSTDRRSMLKAIGVTTVAPTVAPDVLVEATAETMEFTRQAEASSLGSGTLEHLELAIIDFNHAYSHTAPTELFNKVRWYRQRLAQLIQGPHTLRQGRQLYTDAGWLSELLAWLAHDLGDPTAAAAYCVDAWQYGWQAEHDELCAWAMDAKASIAFITIALGRR